MALADEEAGPAVAAQAQTAAAEDCTASPVTGPQPLTTQGRAELPIAADWEGEHWQA